MFKSWQSEIFKSAPARPLLLEFQRRKSNTDARQIFVWDTKAIICPVSWEPIQHDLLKFIYKLKTYHKCIQATVLGKVSSNNDICTRLPAQHTHIFAFWNDDLFAMREQPGAEGHPQHPPWYAKNKSNSRCPFPNHKSIGWEQINQTALPGNIIPSWLMPCLYIKLRLDFWETSHKSGPDRVACKLIFSGRPQPTRSWKLRRDSYNSNHILGFGVSCSQLGFENCDGGSARIKSWVGWSQIGFQNCLRGSGRPIGICNSGSAAAVWRLKFVMGLFEKPIAILEPGLAPVTWVCYQVYFVLGFTFEAMFAALRKLGCAFPIVWLYP